MIILGYLDDPEVLFEVKAKWLCPRVHFLIRIPKKNQEIMKDASFCSENDAFGKKIKKH